MSTVRTKSSTVFAVGSTRYIMSVCSVALMAFVVSCATHIHTPPVEQKAVERADSEAYRASIDKALHKNPAESDEAESGGVRAANGARPSELSEKEQLAIAYRKLTNNPKAKDVFVSLIPPTERAKLPEFQINQVWYALLSDKYEIRDGDFYHRPGVYYEIFVHCETTDASDRHLFTLIYDLFPNGDLEYYRRSPK